MTNLTIKKVTNEKITPRDQCNCKRRNDCPLDCNYQIRDIIYKCIASTTVIPHKIYLGTAEGNFRKRYYNHNTSFKKQRKSKWHHHLKKFMESKRQIQRNALLKVFNYKVCPTILKYHQEVLAMSLWETWNHQLP